MTYRHDSPTIDRIVVAQRRMPRYAVTYNDRAAGTAPLPLPRDAWWADAPSSQILLASEGRDFSLPEMSGEVTLAWGNYIFEGDAVVTPTRDDFGHATSGLTLTVPSIDRSRIPDTGGVTVIANNLTVLASARLWAAVRAPRDRDQYAADSSDLNLREDWQLILRYGHGLAVGDSLKIDGEWWFTTSVVPWDRRRTYDSLSIRRVT